MKPLLLPTYFPSISQFAIMAKSGEVTFEVGDNYQKQTNRNRMYIYSPNGLQMLNIPIKHTQDSHQKTKDIKLETAFDWQRQHFKSLEAAYRSSPFFEYFEDDLFPIFQKKHVFLLDLNLETIELATKFLRLDLKFNKTDEYFADNPNHKDYRFLANGKKDHTELQPYKQVFEEKAGFLNNLSILDLIFNEGRFAVDYLRKQII